MGIHCRLCYRRYGDGMTPTFDVSTLLHMLTFCRPARSPVTQEFIQTFIAPLPGAEVDPYGNWHVFVGPDAATYPILWSCHTDTVHRKGERQTLRYDACTGVIRLSKRSRRTSHCLGADDTAGVFLCHQMIRAGIPGHYVFHHAEEIGGHGSSDLAEHAPNLLTPHTCAIALDRRDTGDIITHQMGRCCSDAFADSLALQLNTHGLHFAPSSSGVFTDTANYIGLIRECTNLSVGYDDAHSEKETLNVFFLQRLFTALCAVDPSALTIERNVDDPDDWGYATGFSWQDYSSCASTIDRQVKEQDTIERLLRREGTTIQTVCCCASLIGLGKTAERNCPRHVANIYLSVQDVPRSPKSKLRVIVYEDCLYCGNPYDDTQSDAIDPSRYCSVVCEMEMCGSFGRDTNVVYLDQELTLRQATKRLKDIL